MPQPIKKGSTIKRATISDFKNRLGLNIATDKNENGLLSSNADKPMEWLVMPKAFQDALKISIPIGRVTTIAGHSNTGKTTILNHVIVSAQRQGYVPVIFDTENNFDFQYAINMGFEAEPVYRDVEVEDVNPETGEVTITTENRIVAYVGNFIYMNNAMLAEKFGDMDYTTGKTTNKKRTVAVIEDVARAINTLLNEADNCEDGSIGNGFVFAWDSIGSVNCWKSYNSSANNAQWDANSLSVAFNTILNDRIPRSRKVSSRYTHTMLIINKVWVDNIALIPTLELRGGNAVRYSSRLVIQCGKQLKAGIKKLTAETKGLKYTWGIQTSLKTIKNQLPAPYTVTYEGDVVCTPHGMIGADKESIEAYKKQYVPDILKSLREMAVNNNVDVDSLNADDIKFTEEEGTE